MRSIKKPKIFQRKLPIRFRDADPAGILYFGHVFSLAHDTFEEFIQAAGLPWTEWFRKGPYFVPIRHTECDFLAPFQPGKTYIVEAQVEKIGNSSFQMKYTFRNEKDRKQIHAIVKMVHAFVSARTKKKINVPNKYVKILEPYLVQTTHHSVKAKSVR